jgi:hypothetical protein
MDNFIDFLSFLRSGLKGKNTHTFLIVVLTLMLYKILGVFGLFLGFLFMFGSDVCGTTNVKTIYNYVKEKLTILKFK